MIILSLIGLVITMALVMVFMAIGIAITVVLNKEESEDGEYRNPCKGGLEHESLADRISEYEESAEVPH